MASYRDALRKLAKSIEAVRSDLDRISGILEDIADEVGNLEKQKSSE